MTYSKEEAENAAKELIKLSLETKELNERIKTLKTELKEYIEVEDIKNHIWQEDNGYVEAKTEIKYKLADIPCDSKVDATVCPIDVAEKAFATKVYLTKEGKQMLREEYPTIMKLMIPTEKRILKVEI